MFTSGFAFWQNRFFFENKKEAARMKILDFHTHIYPEKIARRAVESVGDFYQISMEGEGTAKTLLERGTKAGIDEYVVCSVAIDGDHVAVINDYIATECKNHPEFHGLATIHKEHPQKIQELERAMDLGLVGVKIHPDTQKFNVDDKEMFEVYDYLREKRLPILIHCGDYRYDFSHPRRVKKLLENFPGLTVVAAHFGGWSVYDLAVEYLKDTDCYLDTSSAFSFLGLQRATELIRIYGAERILFGTDFPMWDPQQELNRFLQLPLTETERSLILYDNAQRILNGGI